MSSNKAFFISFAVILLTLIPGAVAGDWVWTYRTQGLILGWALYWYFRHWGDRPSHPL